MNEVQNMAFAKGCVGKEDLARIYSWGGMSQPSTLFPDKVVADQFGRYPWVFDADLSCFLICLPWTRDDASRRYLFGIHGGVLAFREESYQHYKIQYCSPSLESRIEEITPLIEGAFRLGGVLLDGDDWGYDMSTWKVKFDGREG